MKTKHKQKIDLAEARRLYEAGYNCNKIAKHLGVTRQAVYSLLTKHGIYQSGGIPQYIDPAEHKASVALAREERQAFARLMKRRQKIAFAAYSAVTSAIASGMLVPKPCEACHEMPVLANGQRGVHAHHDDYTKPLKVRWLCPKHHSEWHRTNTPRYE